MAFSPLAVTAPLLISRIKPPKPVLSPLSVSALLLLEPPTSKTLEAPPASEPEKLVLDATFTVRLLLPLIETAPLPDRLPMVVLLAATLKVAPLATDTAELLDKALLVPSPCTVKVPALTVVAPVKVLVPVRVKVPAPVLVSPPAPAEMLLMVGAPPVAASTVKVLSEAMVMVLPAKVVPLLTASALRVKLSLMAKLPLSVVPEVANALPSTSVWVPVLSAAAMATASLRLTPLLMSTVAVSEVSVT